MTAKQNGVPDDPADEVVRTREQLETTVRASDAKADDVKGRVQEKAAHAKEAVTGQAGHAAQVTRERLGQAKDKVSEMAPDGAAMTSPPAVRGAGAGVATIGAAIAAIWMLRRRARRNANPWQKAARSAKGQVKTVRKEAKSGLKAARRRSRKQAAAQVATAQAKAHKAKARTWR